MKKFPLNRFRLPLLVLVFSLTGLSLFAGPKMKLLRENARKIKSGTLLIAPILPDSFELAKREKKGPASVQLYLDNIRQANLNLKSAIDSCYQFSKVRFLISEPEMQDYRTYFSFLGTFPADSFYVLQFGQAQQYAGGQKKYIKRYDRDVLTICKTDGNSRMLISIGSVNSMWREEHATAVILSLEKNLKFYSTQTFLVKKKKKK